MPEIHQSQNSREPSPNRSEKASLSEQDALRFFTRSPHPYHRHRVNKSTDKPTSDELSRHNDTPPAASSPSQSDPEVPVAAQGNGKSRRNDSATPSESGTEADDEGYGFIKALPAPPIKPRKGLRDIRGANLDGTPSPLLTPSQLDNQGRNFSQDFLRAIKKSETIALSDDEARAARAKYIKRRRAEVVRRLSEIALLGTIGGLILSDETVWRSSARWHRALIAHGIVDADNHLRLAEKDPGPLKRLKLVTSESARFSRTNLDQDACEVRSAVEHPRKDMFGAANQENGFPRFLKQRSNTLPTFKSRPSPPRRSSTLRHKRAKPSIAQSYLSMTPTQAAVQKWLYAGYVYTAILLIILLPIRAFISAFALHGHEPFGWALSYLFGNIPYLRFQTVYWGLEHWILLPALPSSSPLDPSLGRANYLRHVLLGAANTRLLLFGYWAGILILGLAVVLSLSSIVEVDTRRKVFHGMMVAMLLPTIYIDPAFVSLALELVLAVFLLLDLIRASQLPPLSGPIAKFLTPYVDGRDLRGPVVVSHIFLLIGCAIPLWLSLAGIERAGERPWEGWEVASRDEVWEAQVAVDGGKSLEGSLAFAVAVTVGLVFGKAWLRLGQWDTATDIRAESWGVIAAKAGVAACGASFMEAVLTGGNDNVCVPVVLWLLVRAVGL
ncbi:dolichol kinase [Coniosporium tulheliwenetii]|uniref:Dolichol kinase n=1 Tax=Coniosporium tulheliwenetii TaxID=3383036 RepID=A0ACC2ZCU6_9PEZI|nr:dolichol kinase [Cladosporium sp. JES 115]